MGGPELRQSGTDTHNNSDTAENSDYVWQALPPPTAEDGDDGNGDDYATIRRRLRSRQHALDHYPAINGFPGCDAKARNKNNFKGNTANFKTLFFF